MRAEDCLDDSSQLWPLRNTVGHSRVFPLAKLKRIINIFDYKTHLRQTLCSARGFSFVENEVIPLAVLPIRPYVEGSRKNSAPERRQGRMWRWVCLEAGLSAAALEHHTLC